MNQIWCVRNKNVFRQSIVFDFPDIDPSAPSLNQLDNVIKQFFFVSDTLMR